METNWPGITKKQRAKAQSACSEIYTKYKELSDKARQARETSRVAYKAYCAAYKQEIEKILTQS